MDATIHVHVEVVRSINSAAEERNSEKERVLEFISRTLNYIGVMRNRRKKIIEILKTIWLVWVLFIVELYLRLQPEVREEHVSAMDEVPILFDFCYIGIIVGIIFLIGLLFHKKSYMISKIVFEIIYSFFCLFFISELIYCKIFGRIFGVKELAYAGEGMDFIGVALQYIDINVVVYVGLAIGLGILSWILFPDFSSLDGERIFVKYILVFGVMGGLLYTIVLLPQFFKKTDNQENWNNKGVIYQKWSHNKRATTMFGGYEFLARDIFLTVKGKEVSEEELESINEYLSAQIHKNNEMTGCFEGKNLILVLMESMDEWLITEEETPTLYKMMNEGINFANMYTPMFGVGYTLNSEFASYTGLFAASDGTAIINYANNTFSEALPYLFREKGYTAAAYHYNTGDFYNRFNLQHSSGFEKYVSYLDYLPEEEAEVDSALVNCEEIYSQFVEKEPFFNYLITYSAHGKAGVDMPYSYNDVALEIHPEYEGKYETEELDAIHAKAKLTDEMFQGLLERLEADGILENTVIMGFTDHYAYCFKDKDYLKEISQAENEYELSRTPCFIWNPEIGSLNVNKICNTSDIYPTICNLFSLAPSCGFLSGDIFDDNYEGYAYWPDGSWITADGARYTDIVNGNLDEDAVRYMDQIVAKRIQMNDNILESDYYRSSLREQ